MLFLSKFIPPLFLFPLGIVCLLIGLAIFLVWQKRSNRLILSSLWLTLICLYLSSNSLVSDAIVRSLEYQYLPREIPPAGAIVVLGGGIKPKFYPRPSYDLDDAGDRIIYGVELFKQGKAPKLIFSGGRIDWFQGAVTPESEDMADFAARMGVPREAILEDKTSLNTQQNAQNVKAILAKEQIDRVILVTSAMHMPRSVAIFHKVGIEVIGAPTDFVTVRTEAIWGWQGLMLSLLPNAGALENLTKAIKEYIGLLIV